MMSENTAAEAPMTPPATQPTQDFFHQPYRYMIIAIYGIVNLAAIICTYMFMGMATSIMEQFQIDPSQFSFMCTIGFLVGFILCLPVGSLCDKFGARAVMIVCFVIVVVGAAWRAFDPNTTPTLLTITQVMFGFAFTGVNACVIKSLGAWFEPKQLNFMVAIYIAVATAGAAVGLASGSIFGDDLKTALYFQFGVELACLVLIVLFLRNKPAGAPEPPKDSFFKYIGNTLKFKGAWISALCYMFLYAGTTACNTFIVAGMQDRGMDIGMAALVGILINVTALIGEFVFPAFVSKHTEKNYSRLTLIFLSAATAVCILIAWLVPMPAIATAILMFIAYIFIGGALAQTKALPAQIPGLPPDHFGTAGGFQAMLQNLGAFIGPTYFVALIAGSNYTMIFVLSAVLFAVYFIFCLMIPKNMGLIAQTEQVEQSE